MLVFWKKTYQVKLQQKERVKMRDAFCSHSENSGDSTCIDTANAYIHLVNRTIMGTGAILLILAVKRSEIIDAQQTLLARI